MIIEGKIVLVRSLKNFNDGKKKYMLTTKTRDATTDQISLFAGLSLFIFRYIKNKIPNIIATKEERVSVKDKHRNKEINITEYRIFSIKYLAIKTIDMAKGITNIRYPPKKSGLPMNETERPPDSHCMKS